MEKNKTKHYLSVLASYRHNDQKTKIWALLKTQSVMLSSQLCASYIVGNVKSVSGLPMQTELSWCSLGPVCLHTSPNHQKLNVGSQPRAQLRVQAQSLPPRDLSGLLVQSYNRKHLHSNPVGSFSFFHRFPADVILRAYKRELILKQ